MSGDEPIDDDVWGNAREDALKVVLGDPDELVGHAPVPFDFGSDLGGAADIVYFRNHVAGVVAVTSELIGRGEQIQNGLGNYELMICQRDDATWGASVISRLAHYTLEARLEPGETMDIGPATPRGSSVVAFLFVEYARFEVLGRGAGLLLCLGVTQDELEACQNGQRDKVEAALRSSGVFPFTDLSRGSVLA